MNMPSEAVPFTVIYSAMHEQNNISKTSIWPLLQLESGWILSRCSEYRVKSFGGCYLTQKTPSGGNKSLLKWSGETSSEWDSCMAELSDSRMKYSLICMKINECVTNACITVKLNDCNGQLKMELRDFLKLLFYYFELNHPLPARDSHLSLLWDFSIVPFN